MTSMRVASAGALLVVGLAAFVLVAGQPDGALRPVVVLAYLLTGPGIAIIPLLRLQDRMAIAVLVVPLSLSLDAIVAGATVYLGVWSPTLVIGILVSGTSAAALLQLGTRRGRISADALLRVLRARVR